MTADASTSSVVDRRLLIVYGSETGNSQDAAEDLDRLATRLRFKVCTCEMDDIELGEIPKNARLFWRSLLRKRLPPKCLARLSFTTFGLGDSSYSKYNWAARKLHKRLEQLGASEFYPRGEADERHDDGLDGAFLPWSFSLRTHLLESYPLPEGVSPIPPEVQLPPKYFLELAPTMDSADPARLPSPDSTTTRTWTSPNIPDPKQHDNAPVDRTAAAFSHVDVFDGKDLSDALEESRTGPAEDFRLARLSENTATRVPGGIDALDKPNILRDHPENYRLEDDPLREMPPPERLLPIPDSLTARIEFNKRLTPRDHWQDVRHISFILDPIEDPRSGKYHPAIYRPGDVVTIYPKNFLPDVQTLIDLMRWNDVADKPFIHWSDAESEVAKEQAPRNCHPVPCSTLRQLLTHNYDITAIPKRIFFDQIAWYTEDVTHRERLREFADPKFTDEFYDYTSRPRRSILEILNDFPTVKIPYQQVPSIFPVIRGREYSIASGGDQQSRQLSGGFTRVEILVALVKYKTVLRKTRQGLCSRYLASLPQGTHLDVVLGRHMGPPIGRTASQRPLLAIAPGTGVAPMRSLIWQRQQESSRGRSVLFFGGRNLNADYFFAKEWVHLGVEVHAAFSRDQREKIYVQDKIRQQSELVCSLLEEGAIVCLCGSSGKMPEAVRQALYDVMIKGGLADTNDDAKKKLDTHHDFWEEVW